MKILTWVIIALSFALCSSEVSAQHGEHLHTECFRKWNTFDVFETVLPEYRITDVYVDSRSIIIYENAMVSREYSVLHEVYVDVPDWVVEYAGDFSGSAHLMKVLNCVPITADDRVLYTSIFLPVTESGEYVGWLWIEVGFNNGDICIYMFDNLCIS